MIFTTEIIVNVPRDRFIQLFDNIDNMYKWQPTLQSHEFLEGIPGEPGAKMNLIYLEGKRTVTLVESITKKNLPDEFNGTYEAKGMYTEIQNQFIDLGDGRTKWISNQVIHFSGFFKIIGWLMPGTFKKYSIELMERFKTFAENHKGG